MAFELFCAALIGSLFGAVVCFLGYRLFLFLLPIWGFVFGFGLGAYTLQALFGVGLFASVTSWVVGFVVGAIFALLSYLFYMVAVVFIASSLGWGVGVALMSFLGLDTFGLLTWLVGLGVALIVAAGTVFFNIQKYVIITATAVGGAALSISAIFFGTGGTNVLQLAENPIRTLLSTSPFLAILFLLLALAGVIIQFRMNRTIEIEAYNRFKVT
jgi:hypothetical protein